MLKAQADWILILPTAISCETAASLADKNVCARPILLAHISTIITFLDIIDRLVFV
jgi:hypothetical protein